ncbi:MAG: hypothetical protein ACR2RL_00845, partial [Gammaproteobacteria bacterium]
MALSTTIAHRVARRVVLVIPDQGYKIDLGVKEIAGDFVAYSTELGAFSGGSGSLSRTEQTDRFEMTVLRSDKMAHLRLMAGLECPAVAFVFSYTEHLNWQQPVNFFLSDPGGISEAVRLMMQSTVVRGHVYKGENIVGGYPWYGAQMVEVDTADYRLCPPGHVTDSTRGWRVDA